MLPPASDMQGAVIVGVAVLLGFGLAEALHRGRGLSAEVTRKVAHIWAGVVTASFPWLVESHVTVLWLALGFGVFLGGTRLLGWLPSVHAVERRTQGAYCYPIAVWVTFYLSAGDPVPYVVAISVLALSDTAAAAVGMKQPLKRYHVFDRDYRSLGGSFALFGITFSLVLLLLAAFDRGSLPDVLTIALLVAMAATATEGISVRGLDNLLLPYSVVLILNATLGASAEALSLWVLGALITASIIVPTMSTARLGAAGAMALFLSGFLAFGLGGTAWLVPLLVPYAGFVAARSMDKSTEAAGLQHLAPTFAVSLAVLLAHVHTGRPHLYLPYLASVAAVSALAWSEWAPGRRSPISSRVAAGSLGGAIVVAAGWLAEPPVALDLRGAGTVVAFAAAAPLLAGAVGATTGKARLAGVLGSTAGCTLWVLV